MTTREIKTRCERIKELDDMGDYEAAHAAEDALKADFIKYLASRKSDEKIKECRNFAKLILELSDYTKERHCA